MKLMTLSICRKQLWRILYYLGFVDLCRVDGNGVGGSYGGSSVGPAIIVFACLKVLTFNQKEEN